MNCIVNNLLIASLLFCPYVCMADQMQSGCGSTHGCASSDSTTKLGGESARDCCSCTGRMSKQQDAFHTDGTPSSPKPPPKQCLCEGAIAVADVREHDSCDLHLSTIAFTVRAIDDAGDSLTRPLPGDARTGERPAGREVCVRVCALLI